MNHLRGLLLLALSGQLFAADLSQLKKHDPEAIAKAMAADQKVVDRARDQSLFSDRPGHHITAPANWINDPNGPIFHDGYWHMFYQHNPYGDEWGHMHWGHVRSRDLAHWEHLPIALWPSKEVGEEHVFSGCATIREDGRPAIFYTSIKQGKSATDFAEQWIALGDKNLLRWEKPASNPALSEVLHGQTKVWDWRDPYLFKYKGADYMVLGGNLNKGKGGAAVVTLYKAKDPSLEAWEYLGILFTHPDPKVTNIECPNFFELDGKWVLIISPHRRVEYFTGDFDGKKFTHKTQGLVDHSDDFYAPNCTTDDKGRRVLWGWIRNFKKGQGWNGALTVPRVLKVDSRGRLIQWPVEELSKLRTKEVISSTGSVSRTDAPPKNTASESFVGEANTSQLEIFSEMHSGNNTGVRILASDTDPGFEISYSNGELTVGNKKAPLELGPNDPVQLHIFVDRSVVEVYANGTTCLTAVHYFPSEKGNVEFFTRERNTAFKVAAHELRSAMKGKDISK